MGRPRRGGLDEESRKVRSFAAAAAGARPDRERVAATHARKRGRPPIVIGWAFDSRARWRRSTGPALAAAPARVKQVEREGRRRRPAAADPDLRHAGQQARDREGVRGEAARPGREHHLHDLRRRLRRAGRAGGDQRGVLAVAPCIGTDQMGPKRFGAKGKLAFSFGNVAQDEGSAMAQYAWRPGWRTAALATDTVIVYFKNVVAGVQGPLQAARRQDRRQETYQSLGGTNVHERRQPPEQRQNADVIVTSTAGAFGALSTFVSGLRTLGNNTPILNSWAGDGTYWLPKSPKVTNYCFVTFASVFGDDPSTAVNTLAKQVKAGHRRLRHRRRPRSTASSPRSSAPAARRTARRSRRRWRSSRRCRRSRAS